MKLSLLALFTLISSGIFSSSLLANPESLSQLESPRATFRTFLKAMVQVKEGQNTKNAYAQASSTLDLSWVDTTVREEAGKKASDNLIAVLDKLEKIDYEKIPDSLDKERWTYDKRSVKVGEEKKKVEICLVKKEGKWLFSQETLGSLSNYARAFRHLKNVQGVSKLSNWRHKVESKLPAWAQDGFFGMAIWQWLGLGILILISYLIEKVVMSLVSAGLNKNIRFLENAPKSLIKKASIPFGKVILLYLVHANLYWLNLDPTELAVIKRAIYVLSALAVIWFGHRMVEVVAFYFMEKARATESKFDDIMVPLVTKTSFILVYIIGALILLSALTVDVTGLLAGLGIGGIAVAYAAKDTLANFFGSIMLVLDRPFDIGDVITTGDIEGTVVEVGFRSTRIRTFYDSIITVSNGELMNRSIDNKGKRRYRRLSTTLGLEYDTPPQKIEAFCEGIRQLILNHKWTRKDYFNVYFTNFGASSLDIQLMVFWETDDYTREQTEKHRLMIDILRLAKDLEVNFAFPTQTVHMFNENAKPEHRILEKYLDDGINHARALLGQPLSLKNPRSNANDENQFGKNDIGN